MIYLLYNKDTCEGIKEQLETTKAKLVEVEMYLSSEKGNVTLQLEEELAAAKLRIAELEAEKDDMEIELRRKYNSRGIKYNSNSSAKHNHNRGEFVISTNGSNNNDYDSMNKGNKSSFNHENTRKSEYKGGNREHGSGKENMTMGGSPTRSPGRQRQHLQSVRITTNSGNDGFSTGL